MKQVPVVMVLMSRRTAADYYEVFKSIIALLECVPTMDLLDYGSALWKTINDAFPPPKKWIMFPLLTSNISKGPRRRTTFILQLLICRMKVATKLYENLWRYACL